MVKVFTCKNVLYLFGSINNRNSNMVVRHLMTNPDITRLVLSSGGGNISDAIKICETLRLSQFKIDVRVQGEACSSATFILASACGKREMTKNSYLMFHLPYVHTDKKMTSICMDNHLTEMKFMEHVIESLVMSSYKNNKKMHNFYKDFMSTHKDFYLTAKEAFDLGIIDSIV